MIGVHKIIFIFIFFICRISQLYIDIDFQIAAWRDISIFQLIYINALRKRKFLQLSRRSLIRKVALLLAWVKKRVVSQFFNISGRIYKNVIHSNISECFPNARISRIISLHCASWKRVLMKHQRDQRCTRLTFLFKFQRHSSDILFTYYILRFIYSTKFDVLRWGKVGSSLAGRLAARPVYTSIVE